MRQPKPLAYLVPTPYGPLEVRKGEKGWEIRGDSSPLSPSWFPLSPKPTLLNGKLRRSI